MIKFDKYYYREDEDPKIFISLDWYKFEDDFHRLYSIGGLAAWEPEVMERKQKENENRHRWLRVELNICGLRLSVEIRLKHVGAVRYGKIIDQEKRAEERREMIERRRKK